MKKMLFFVALVMLAFAVPTESLCQISDSLGKWKIVEDNLGKVTHGGTWARGVNMFLDPKDNLYIISSFLNDQVLKYDEKTKRSYPCIGNNIIGGEKIELNIPTCGVFISNEVAFIGEAGSEDSPGSSKIRMVEFDKKGDPIKCSVFADNNTLLTFGITTGFNQIMNLYWDEPEKILYVMNSSAHNILACNFKDTTWSEVFTDVDLLLPTDIEKLKDGSFLILQTWANNVLKIDPNGNVSVFYGRNDTSNLAKLDFPMGHCLAKDNLLIADSRHNRIVAVDLEKRIGILFAGYKNSNPGIAMGKFNFIEEIISTKNGKVLYTSEYDGNRIQKYKGRKWYYVAGRLYGQEVVDYEVEKDSIKIAYDTLKKEPIVFDDNIRIYKPNDYWKSNAASTLYFHWQFKKYGNITATAFTCWGPDDKNVPQYSYNGFIQKLLPGEYSINKETGEIDKIYLLPYDPNKATGSETVLSKEY